MLVPRGSRGSGAAKPVARSRAKGGSDLRGAEGEGARRAVLRDRQRKRRGSREEEGESSEREGWGRREEGGQH